MLSHKCLFLLTISFIATLFGCSPSAERKNEGPSNKNVVQPLINPKDDARFIVESANKQCRWDDLETRWKIGRIKLESTGEFSPVPDAIFVIEDTFNFPDQFRRIVKFKGEEKTFFAIVQNNNEGWYREADGVIRAVPDSDNQKKKAAHILAGLFDLAPLNRYRLSVLGMENVAGRETIVVRANLGNPNQEEYYYFGESDALLYKLKKTFPSMEDGHPTILETHYDNYKKISGIGIPHTILASRDGKRYLRLEILDYEFSDKIDAKLFEKASIERLP